MLIGRHNTKRGNRNRRKQEHNEGEQRNTTKTQTTLEHKSEVPESPAARKRLGEPCGKEEARRQPAEPAWQWVTERKHKGHKERPEGKQGATGGNGKQRGGNGGNDTSRFECKLHLSS